MEMIAGAMGLWGWRTTIKQLIFSSSTTRTIRKGSQRSEGFVLLRTLSAPPNSWHTVAPRSHPGRRERHVRQIRTRRGRFRIAR